MVGRDREDKFSVITASITGHSEGINCLNVVHGADGNYAPVGGDEMTAKTKRAQARKVYEEVIAPARKAYDEATAEAREVRNGQDNKGK